MSSLYVKDITFWESGPEATLSARIGDFDLYYKAPQGCGLSLSAEPFLAAALLPAMARGDELRLAPDYAVSSSFVDNLNEIQKIFACWSHRLHPVRIECATRPPLAADRSRVGSFYSGGIDSMYTALTSECRITDLIIINGFDFIMEPEVFQESIKRNQKFAASLSKNLVPVETNFKVFGHHYGLARVLSQGSALASVGLALRYGLVYIPSSHDYNHLAGWGTHPLTDPLWTDGEVRFIHHALEVSRVEKTRLVASNPAALAALRVCWMNHNQHCGVCSKCVRTMLTLELIGAGTGPFPPFRLEQLKTLEVSDSLHMLFVVDMLALAKQCGRLDIARILRRKIRRYYLSVGRVYIDRLFLGSALSRIRSAVAPREPYDDIEFDPPWPAL